MTYAQAQLDARREGMREGKLEGLQEGLREGKREGLREGMLENSRKVAASMLAAGIPLPVIAQCVEHPIEEVREWLGLKAEE